MSQGLQQAVSLPMASPSRRQNASMTAASFLREKRAPKNWRQVGSCRDSDPNLFYPLGRGRPALEQMEVAKLVCRACPSREPCLDFALATRQELGVWGGTSPEDRRRLTRERRRAVAS